MDAIILAAGRGSRLKGVLPPFHKPMMLGPDGRTPLIINAIKSVPSRYPVTLVLAPENALPICQLLDATPDLPSDICIVVQRGQRGPGEAFLQGWTASRGDGRALILMSDNTLTQEDVNTCVNRSGADRVIVGGQRIAGPLLADAERFTRVYPEHKPAFFEGPRLRGFEPGVVHGWRWCGPLVVNGINLAMVLRGVDEHEAVPELKLGRYLGYLDGRVEVVEVSTTDVGEVPEETGT